MQKIFNFFPLTVYKSTLSLSENEKNEMIEEVRLMEKKSKNLDYDNTEQLKNFVEGITHFENSANSEDYRNYYTEKDYEDAVKLFQEKKLFEQIDNVETKGEGFEMRKLGL